MRERFPILIKARAPSVLREAIKAAAEKDLTTPSEWIRRAVLRQLREDGIGPQTVSQPTGGIGTVPNSLNEKVNTPRN